MYKIQTNFLLFIIMAIQNNTEIEKVAIFYGSDFVKVGDVKYPSEMSVSCFDNGGGLVKLTLASELRHEFGNAMPKRVFEKFTPSLYLNNKLNEFMGID